MTDSKIEKLTHILSDFEGKNVLIIGDLMLDEYVWGNVKRISPEAPVPVVNVKNRTYMAGGAGNTASNIASLGGIAKIIGVIGDDLQGDLLREKLGELGISTSGLEYDTGQPTITKTRIIANKQHVVRVDIENRQELNSEIQSRIIKNIESELHNVQAVIISDYGKQIVTKEISEFTIRMAQKNKIPVIVDPKGNDFKKYKGATVITPNILETEYALNIEINSEDDLVNAGKKLNDFINGTAILITRGSEGMSLFINGGTIVHIPAVARNLYDVTGAGDTVVSTIAMALAAGAALEDSVYLANQAAGLVVEKLGTATVTKNELLKTITVSMKSN